MKITEDKADRDRLFHRLTEERFTVRAKGYEPARVAGWARKHELWPCGSERMRVLTGNFRWTRLPDVRVGDTIIAFNEHPTMGLGDATRRRWQYGQVRDVLEREADVVRYHMADGASLELTPDHPMLGKRWIEAGRASYFRRLIRTWDNDPTWERGYLAGMFDADGSLSIGRTPSVRKGRSWRLTLGQVDNAALHRVLACLRQEGFDTTISWRATPTNVSSDPKPIAAVVILGGSNEVLRFLGQIRPVRLRGMECLAYLPEKVLTTKPVKIIGAEPLGKMPVFDLVTDTHTFIMEGFASHNCVRLGAGGRWLRSRGWNENPGTRRRALNFLRGHSHEALLTEGQSLVFIYQGVGNEIDEWTGEAEAPFTEVKSTVVSSARMWPIVKSGSVDILSPLEDSYFQSYFEQCCQNCVAVGVDRCRLRIFFMNGEYAGRRKGCPECGEALEELRDVYRECASCHYRAYSIDLRSYILTFSQKELSYFRSEVFRKRRDQYNLAIQSSSVGELLMRAEPTRCFLCSECAVGREIGCEYASKGSKP